MHRFSTDIQWFLDSCFRGNDNAEEYAPMKRVKSEGIDSVTRVQNLASGPDQTEGGR